MPKEIAEPATISKSKTKLVDFPEDLPITEEIDSFRAVHNLLTNINLSSLGLKDADTFAQHNTLENQKAHILRFLWIFGNYGTLNEENSHLTVDSEIYQDNRGKQKTLSIWSFVKDIVFNALVEFGVCCELIALDGIKIEDLTTGTGYLRKKGWVMNISFEKKIGGSDALKALQTCTKKLDKKYGSKAIQRFQNADMTFLLQM